MAEKDGESAQVPEVEAAESVPAWTLSPYLEQESARRTGALRGARTGTEAPSAHVVSGGGEHVTSISRVESTVAPVDPARVARM